MPHFTITTLLLLHTNAKNHSLKEKCTSFIQLSKLSSSTRFHFSVASPRVRALNWCKQFFSSSYASFSICGIGNISRIIISVSFRLFFPSSAALDNNVRNFIPLTPPPSPLGFNKHCFSPTS